MAEKIFQGWQNGKRCPREQFMKKVFKKQKISLFFPIMSILFTSSENFR